jgi:hypothetical protein
MAAPAIYLFPSNATLQEIETERSRIIDENSVAAQILPYVSENTDNVMWEILDDVTGLMHIRDAGEPYPLVQDVGGNRFVMAPIRLGEKRVIDEVYIEAARQPGTMGTPLDVGGKMGRLMQDIAIREHATIEKARWDLLVAGVATGTKKDGTVVEIARMVPVTASSAVAWSTLGSATPIVDFLTIRETYRGRGYDFGYGAVAYARSLTIDKLLLNTNTSDIGKVKLNFGQSFIDMTQYNNQIRSGFNTPSLVAVDDGYVDSAGVFQPFIPDGKVVIVGNHWSRGLNAGNWVSTRNASNAESAPGIFAAAGLSREEDPPVLPYAVRGQNGGVRINYRNQIVVLTAY